jgi:hypothetical protein
MAFRFFLFLPAHQPWWCGGATPAGSSRFLSLGGPLPGSLRGVHGPTAAAVIALGSAPRDLRVGCDHWDPPRPSRHHGWHGHTAGAVIAVTATAAARLALRACRVGCDQQDPARPLKGGP